MKKVLATMATIGLVSGCASSDWSRSVFPSVPAAKSEAKASNVADKKDVSEATTKSEPVKSRGPVTAQQVTERNTQEILKALEAELDQAASKAGSKP